MRLIRRLVHVLLIVLTLVVGAAAAATVVSQTAWFKDRMRGYIIREANQYLHGQLSIGRLGGNLLFGIELEDIGVSLDGKEVVTIKDVGLEYNVFELVTKGLSINSLRLNKPVIYLQKEGDAWSIARLVKRQEREADRTGPERSLQIDEIGISDGLIAIEGLVVSGVEVPKRFEHLDAKLAFRYEPVRYSIDIEHVSFRGLEPAIGLNALSGGVSVKNDTIFLDKLAMRTEETSLSVDGAIQQYLSKPILNLQITSDKTSLEEVGRVVPSLAGMTLQPAFAFKVDGPLDRLAVDLNVRSSAGLVSGKVTADLLEPGQSAAGTVSIRHLDLAPLLGNPASKSDISGDATIDVSGVALADVNTLHGKISLVAARAQAFGYVVEDVNARATIEGRRVALVARAAAYGASATATGNVRLPESKGEGAAAYDLRGQIRGLDMAKLPPALKAPRTETDLNADYHAVGVAGSGRNQVDGDLRFLPSSVPGARIASGSTAAFSVDGQDVSYRADATATGVNLQRLGTAFDIPALAADRYQSSLNVQVTAEGRGTRPETMNLAATGTLTDSTVSGGRIPSLRFDASTKDNVAHVRLNGTVTDVDPALVAGKPAWKGAVGGDIDVDATVSGWSNGVSVDNLEATVKANLQPSRVGGIEIESARIDGDYARSSGVIRTFEITGRDLNVKASGTLALNGTDQSNLTFHADTPSLETVGQLLDVPVVGIGRIDGTVTGNRTELTARGTLTGNGVKYGENGALGATTDYTATVPNLSFADARIAAKTHGTFVTVAGQNINEIDATTTYENKKLDFDLTAKQPERTVGAAGSLVVHPDHQEVHLERLALDTQGQSWQLAPGGDPTIRYAHEAVTVEDLRLTSGDQRILAEGTLGRADEELKLTLENVDLAGVDALLLRPPQLSGRLNATAAISGTTAVPRVDADFQVTQGGFQKFAYESLAGKARYGGKGVTLDATLRQNSSSWITAKGYVPVAAFKAPPAEDRVHGETANAEDRFDLHIDSSSIDLGIVQGFTTELTNVTGSIQAKVDITGAADDPHPNGAITIANGAFKAETTGVAYTGLHGQIDLQDDRVHVDYITLVDNRDQTLRVSGDLSVHAGQLGEFAVYINAWDFRVINNEMGDLRVNSDLRIMGKLSEPRIEGDLAVNTGTINLDPILANFGTSAYSTTQTEYNRRRAAANTGQAPRPAAGFRALRVDVNLTVPNDLVVKGNDLRLPDAPIGLGAMSLTLGGDLRITKAPRGRIAIVGPVRTIRGYYDFQGRRFTILRDGSVQFVGLNPPNPTLHIRTERVIQGVTAHVNIEGTLRSPQIVLTSTPPLEEADILSLIVFNQPVNQLGQGQQVALAQRAGQLATGALAGTLAQSIGNALNLNEFDINTAPEGGAAAELTVGQQVGKNLFVKVQQSVGDQSQTNVVLEYELTNWLRLRTNVVPSSSAHRQQMFQSTKDSGVDLLFFFSY